MLVFLHGLPVFVSFPADRQGIDKPDVLSDTSFLMPLLVD